MRYIDDLILRDAGSTRFYGLQDANWNAVAVLNQDGSVFNRVRYASYGDPTFLTATGLPTNSLAPEWEYLFCGYRYDFTAGMYYARNRYLSYSLGLWLTRDLSGYADGPNIYNYAHSNPISRRDPSGLVTESELQQMVTDLKACGAAGKLFDTATNIFKNDPEFKDVPSLPPKITTIEIDGLPPNASHPKTGAIRIDSTADRCTTFETLLIEVGHLARRSDYLRILEDPCKFSSRDAYILAIEKLEFASLQGMADIWKQCAKQWGCDETKCPTPGFGSPDDVLKRTFEEHFGRLAQEHKDNVAFNWDNNCK